ncbi:hypothetical protein QBC40DRAFT_284050 [Triangularia verruculosa]|uniref:Uncharacterized protein n=1 Tax=Triangularia verruculosa TaxID=2587418 RepID=A0AAN6XCX6_9PEZI|nr:hypothetical protein QBC40DRAFT_284050 [Triangularia verruculosa]
MRVKALLLGAALFGGTRVLGQVQPNIKFITPPNIEDGEHDMRNNPVHEEGSRLPISWSPAPEGTRISLTLFQHNTTDGGSIGDFEYITQGTVGVTRHNWIVATTKDIADSAVFRIILFIEGETGGHTGTEFFNITRRANTVTTTTSTSSTTLPTSTNKDESDSSSTSTTSTPSDTSNTNNSAQTTNPSDAIPTSSGLSSGAAAGIGVGATVAVLILAGVAFYFFFFKPRQEKKQAALLTAGGAIFPSPGATPHQHYSQVPSGHGPPSMYSGYTGVPPPPSVSPGPPGMTQYKPPNYYQGAPPQPPSEMAGDWRGQRHEMATAQMASFELPGNPPR